jgi:hypothetical protein
MNLEEAVRRAFEAQQVGSDLVKRLLSLAIKPNSEKLMIVVFTGYGLPLADFARDVSNEFSKAPILVLGPDSKAAARQCDQTKDAVSYRTHIHSLDEGIQIRREVVTDASQDTQNTPGQATVAARRFEEEGVETALLVTAAYHQPRAYMTLLKSLIKRGIEDRVRLFPKPYCLSRDWDAKDPDLKDKKSWASAFGEDELPRIIEYQRKGDVALWQELERYLEKLDRAP